MADLFASAGIDGHDGRGARWVDLVSQLPPQIRGFIELLRAFPGLPDVFNPWRQQADGDAIPFAADMRCALLGTHLSGVDQPIVFFGEAPSYQGCRTSGVPFTSERQILEGIVPRVSRLYLTEVAGQRLSSRATPWSENSGTIVWHTLHNLGLAKRAVMFNSFPFHPEGVNGPYSNRTPTHTEFSVGAIFLRAFLECFPDSPIVTVGRHAEHLVGQAAAPARRIVAKLRHPAYGGAKEFAAGLRGAAL